MITREVQGNVFTSGCRNIAFGINTEGHNSVGFAGIIAARYWPGLAHIGQQSLGTVHAYHGEHHSFHAMVCHSARPRGFAEAPTFITVCLDAIQVPDDEKIACVLVGAGPLERAAGADTLAILGGIERSRKHVAVYTL